VDSVRIPYLWLSGLPGAQRLRSAMFKGFKFQVVLPVVAIAMLLISVPAAP